MNRCKLSELFFKFGSEYLLIVIDSFVALIISDSYKSNAIAVLFGFSSLLEIHLQFEAIFCSLIAFKMFYV